MSASRVLRQLAFDTGLTAERLSELRFLRFDEVSGSLRLLEPGADERDWVEYNLSLDAIEALSTILADRSWWQFIAAAT